MGKIRPYKKRPYQQGNQRGNTGFGRTARIATRIHPTIEAAARIKAIELGMSWTDYVELCIDSGL